VTAAQGHEAHYELASGGELDGSYNEAMMSCNGGAVDAAAAAPSTTSAHNHMSSSLRVEMEPMIIEEDDCKE